MQHFSGLLSVENNDHVCIEFTRVVDAFLENSKNIHINHEIDDTLNGVINEEEIMLAIGKMKNNKSTGPDGLVIEMYKHTQGILVPLICKLFNTILYSGICPTDWAKSIIVPVHKSGPTSVKTNFRGISLLDVTCKSS